MDLTKKVIFLKIVFPFFFKVIVVITFKYHILNVLRGREDRNCIGWNYQMFELTEESDPSFSKLPVYEA